MRPSVKFIDHEPPPDGRSGERIWKGWSGFVIGQLVTQPGRWAIVDTGGDQPSRDAGLLKNQGTRLGIEIEAVSRARVLYARVTA